MNGVKVLCSFTALLYVQYVSSSSVLSFAGSPMIVTVDGDVFEALLSNMIPGKLYQVSVSSVKGLEESDPSMDTVTTGWPPFFSHILSPLLHGSLDTELLSVLPSFGPTSGSDSSQCYGHVGPAAVAAVRGHRGWLCHYLHCRFRCVCIVTLICL